MAKHAAEVMRIVSKIKIVIKGVFARLWGEA